MFIKNLKNTLIKSCVALMKHTRNNVDCQEKRFLIVSTTALGDTLWGTPAIKALRETYPQNYIAVLTSPIGKEVLAHNPHINELFVMKNPALGSLFSLYGKLKEKKFSHIFILHISQRPVLPCMALLNPEMLIGSAKINKGLDSLLTDCLSHDPNTHEIERRLELIIKAGGQPSSRDLELFLDPDDERQAEEWIQSLSLASDLPLIALHPGAKDSFKQWPPSHFIALGKRLKTHLECALFVTGTPSEKALVDQIVSQIPGAHAATHLPLRAFAALLKKMNLLVTNDTGPLHVACAMNTPTIALFAPTDPRKCGSYHAKNVTIINKGPTCSPCLYRKCPSAFCLLQIGVQEVYDAAMNMVLRGET